MKQFRRTQRYRGYGKRGLFAPTGHTRQFSTSRLVLAIVLVGGGVCVLIWGLSYAKGALP